MKVDLRLYAILDPERTRGRDLADLARAAAAGGATLVQYRDKHAGTRDLVARTRAIGAALAGTGVPLLVNDRVDVALAAGADGVHVGQDDMQAGDARRLLGPQAIIGVTLKTLAHVAELATLPVDYGCIGGVFATESKDNPDPPVGLAGLARLVDSARGTRPGLPVGAIAGIDATNAAAVIGAGADGIAVISAVFMAEDVEAAAHNLRGIVDGALAARGATDAGR
ncbi:thiamine-phosphate pyrophosphorylase [Chelatococcus caeni]|uniref:Thiamine-phosphate synthase n=1 Tax=Chelatococcus caeni TaxID=1348468 RepID=A0A840C2F9_9HYPH|nr:thiamine phosphate synthase [Chelatococcus caeni]MBB4017838.1 thiamine-phosphate pyrophosphorylase [Chelatococcus caeni]